MTEYQYVVLFLKSPRFYEEQDGKRMSVIGRNVPNGEEGVKVQIRAAARPPAPPPAQVQVRAASAAR